MNENQHHQRDNSDKHINRKSLECYHLSKLLKLHILQSMVNYNHVYSNLYYEQNINKILIVFHF